MAIIRIKKWGKGWGIRIPQSILDELALQPDTCFVIQQSKGIIFITPIRDRKTTLDELLDQITSANLHGEVDWGVKSDKEAQ